MRRQPKAAAPGGAKAALALLLTLLLILAAGISVNDSLHNSLHANGAFSHHSCLACAFTAGQMAATEAALCLVAVLLCFFGLLHQPNSAPLRARDFRVAPSRAPPQH